MSQTQTKIQELLDDTNPDQYTTIRISKITTKRLDSKGRYRDSYERIINRILDEKEGLETPEGEGSF
jgi:hypothetical protein